MNCSNHSVLSRQHEQQQKCSRLRGLHRSVLDLGFWILLQLSLSQAFTITCSLFHSH